MYKKIIFIIILTLVAVTIVVMVLIWRIRGDAGKQNQKTGMTLPQENLIKEEANGSKVDIEKKVFISFSEPENDVDHDGVKDDIEVKLGSSTKTNDTDHDGLIDKIEIEKYKTDPTKFDTDNDGFGDGTEVVNGYSPLGPGKLDTTKLNQ